MNRLWIVFSVLICLVLFLPCLAFADSIPVTGDWTVEYEIDSNCGVGVGGAGKIILDVTNTSSSETIKYVGVSMAPGRESNVYLVEEVSIGPGENDIVEFSFRIYASDVRVPLQAQVCMSHGTETEVDGWGFVNGLVYGEANYDLGINVTSDNTVIEQGENAYVNVDIDYAGNDFVRLSIFDQDGNLFRSISRVTPGEALHYGVGYDDLTETTTFQYTVNVYTMDGVGTLVNEVESNELTITVNSVLDTNCDFDINLTADKTTVEAGEDVNFSIFITNTGDDIGQLELTDMDAMTLGRFEGLASGDSAVIPITQSFDETQDVSFVVVAVIGDMQKAKQTNTVRITVGEKQEEEPASTPEQVEIPTIQHETETNAEAVITENSNSSQSDDNQNNIEVATAENDVVSSENQSYTLKIVLIILIGLVLVGIVILIYLVIDKKREEARKNNFR